MVSVILFGSVVAGGFSEVSDVDLILVLPDGMSVEERLRIRDDVSNLEVAHGWRLPFAKSQRLEAFMARVTATERSFFSCTRGDLLSGDVGRILGLQPSQAVFVDRIVMPSVLSCARTVWGEDLLAKIPMRPIRRLDIFKAFFGLSCQVIPSVLLYPLLPSATKYAMGALKKSVQSCYFCYFRKSAALDDEVAFFERMRGPSTTLNRLMELRSAFAPSFLFTIRCIPTMVRLHARAAWDNRLG
jgi:hypothetical protein